jgi:hypothetical protein
MVVSLVQLQIVQAHGILYIIILCLQAVDQHKMGHLTNTTLMTRFCGELHHTSFRSKVNCACTSYYFKF